MPSIRTRRPPAVPHLLLGFAVFVVAIAAPCVVSAATLSGRVIDPDHRPVAGARVIVTTALGTIAERTSDSGGAFSFADVRAGVYDLRVVAEGFQADPFAVTLAADESRDVVLQLRLSAVSEAVVVSAAQVDVPLSRAADSVTVITAEDLRARQIETVADALRDVPGLTLARSGDRGAITSLFPRGGASNYTLVLVDGMRANLFGGGYDFADLSVADVERVEIVRGPESALFGADAIGAVVHVVTRRGGQPHVDGLAEGGSDSFGRATASAAGSIGGWSFGGGAEHVRTDGFTGVAPATGEHVTNDDYAMSHASGTVGWARPNGPEFNATASLTNDERGLPGPFGSDPIGAYPGVDRVSRSKDHDTQLGVRFSHPWSALARQRIDANYTDLVGDFTSPFGASSTGTRRYAGRIQEDVAFNTSLGASAGVELLSERGSSTFITGETNEPLPIRRFVAGTFGELRYVARERLVVTGGVRVEHITRDLVEPNFGAFTSRPELPEQTVNSVNPKIAVSYAFDHGDAVTRLHASAGTGIRPPDAFEIAFTDNPDLRPERSRSVDAGVDQTFAGGRHLVSATAFFNRYDDLIVTVGKSLHDASRYMSDNIGNARARGVEVNAATKITPHLNVRASYTFLDAETLSVDHLTSVTVSPFHVGDPLLRRPRHQGGAGVTWSAGRAGAFAELTWRARALDVEPNFGAFGGLFYSPGYAVVNAGGSVRMARAIDAYVRVLNVGDRHYEETLGFPALRRSVVAGVRVAAGR